MNRLIPAVLVAMSCASPSPNARNDGKEEGVAAAAAEVAAAMERYQAAARTVDPDSMADHYTAGATLLEPGIPPIVSRDSIRAFLASFPGARVEVATASPDTIEVHGSTAYLWGTFFERLFFPGQPVSEQRGRFVAHWVREDGGRWRMHRLYRIPVATSLQLPASAPKQ